MTSESFDPNPYATPATISEIPIESQPSVRTPWLRRLMGLQAAVIVISLALENYEHETIVGTGQVFCLVGLVIMVLAKRHHDRYAMLFGASAILFAAFIVVLINYNSWSPAQGDRPITNLSLTYAAFALPTAAWLAFARHEIVNKEAA